MRCVMDKAQQPSWVTLIGVAGQVVRQSPECS